MGMSDYEVGVVLATADVAKARDFYEQKLGLKPGDESGDGDPQPLIYPCAGNNTIAVYHSPEHAGKSTATLAGWRVDDVEKVVDELTARGVVFEQYDEGDLKTDEKGIVENDGFKVAFMRDPDGNTHALNGG